MLKYVALFALLAIHGALAQTVETITVPQWACNAFGAAETQFGSGYAPGTYTLPLAGGTGAGASAIITVGANGVVNNIVPNTYGHDYSVGDMLTAKIPSGHGFSLKIVATRNLPMDENGTEIRVYPKRDAPWHHTQLPLATACIKPAVRNPLP